MTDSDLGYFSENIGFIADYFNMYLNDFWVPVATITPPVVDYQSFGGFFFEFPV